MDVPKLNFMKGEYLIEKRGPRRRIEYEPQRKVLPSRLVRASVSACVCVWVGGCAWTKGNVTVCVCDCVRSCVGMCLGVYVCACGLVWLLLCVCVRRCVCVLRKKVGLLHVCHFLSPSGSVSKFKI